MRKLGVFNLVTLDGYFTGEGGDISWHKVDEEFQELAERNSASGSTLLFGRVTYELMASYWPAPAALKSDPVVARGMNASPKVVFSRTLKEAGWENTRLVKGGLLAEVRRLKRGRGKPLIVLGSGTIVAQLAEAGLVDEYQLLLVPVAIGRGRALFEGVKRRLDLDLVSTRRFFNGNLLLTYRPARKMTEDWIKRYFKAEHAAEALKLLDGYGAEEWHREPDRVKRDAVIVSRGSLESLKAAVELARKDYRDILAGEEVDPWVIAELRKWSGK